jgi:hypothetical protein
MNEGADDIHSQSTFRCSARNRLFDSLVRRPRAGSINRILEPTLNMKPLGGY